MAAIFSTNTQYLTPIFPYVKIPLSEADAPLVYWHKVWGWEWQEAHTHKYVSCAHKNGRSSNNCRGRAQLTPRFKEGERMDILEASSCLFLPISTFFLQSFSLGFRPRPSPSIFNLPLFLVMNFLHRSTVWQVCELLKTFNKSHQEIRTRKKLPKGLQMQT